MRYTIPAGTYFGIPVRIHFTFPLILLVFGAQAWMNGTPADAVRAVGLILAVFLCVVLHEYGHSLQIRRYGIQVRDILLLPIGGMARAERLPEKPHQEFLVAIAGPAVNFVIAAILFAIIYLRSDPVILGDDFVTNLFFINIVLGVFNLIPAFPMDGGRILRGFLAMKFSYLRATRYARVVGQIIALLFVVIGFMNSAFIMLPVIAVFIFFGAMNEEQMIRVKTTLENKRVADLLRDHGPLLRFDDTIDALLERVSKGNVAVAATDDIGSATAAVYVADAFAAVREGRGGDPLGTIARFDFPVLLADMSATRAYYFLKAEKKPVAGVLDGDHYIGIVHFDAFLETED